MAVLVPYLLGVVTAPLAKNVLKPMVRGAAKATAGVALEMKRTAAEAREEVQVRQGQRGGEPPSAGRPAQTSVAGDLRAHDETVHEVSAERPAPGRT